MEEAAHQTPGRAQGSAETRARRGRLTHEMLALVSREIFQLVHLGKEHSKRLGCASLKSGTNVHPVPLTQNHPSWKWEQQWASQIAGNVCKRKLILGVLKLITLLHF